MTETSTSGRACLAQIRNDADLRHHVGQAFEGVDAADLAALAHARGEHAELAAEMAVVVVHRHDIAAGGAGAGAGDELHGGEFRPHALRRREEAAGMADNDLVAAAGIVAHRLDMIGRRDVLGIRDVVAELLHLHQAGIAGRVPALVVDAARQQHGDLGLRGSGRRRERGAGREQCASRDAGEQRPLRGRGCR